MNLFLVLLFSISVFGKTSKCGEVSLLIQKSKEAIENGIQPEGLRYLHNAEKLMISCPDSIKARVWHQLSVSHLFSNNKDSVIYYAKKVLEYSSKHTDQAIRIKSLTNLAMLSNQTGAYENALYYNQQAFNYYSRKYNENPNDTTAFKKSLTASNLALTFQNLKQTDSVSAYLKLSTSLHSQFENNNFKGYNLQLAYNLTKKERPLLAKNYFKEAMSLARKTQNFKQLTELHLIFLESDNLVDSNKGLAFLQNEPIDKLYPGGQIQVAAALKKYYKKKGDFKKSLQYFELLDSLKKQEKKEKASKELALVTQKYKDERDQNNRLKEEVRLKARKVELFGFGMAILTLLAIIVILSIKFYHKQKLTAAYFKNQEDFERIFDLFNGQQGGVIVSENPIYNKLLSKLKQTKAYLNPSTNLSDLAALVGTNTKYLSNAVNEVTGNNINYLLNSMRVTEAKLLIESHLRKNEIKNLNEYWSVCGFNSNVSFYRAFNKIAGESPASYKNKIAELIKKE